MTTPKRKLRSAEWFGTADKNGFMYRSWMKNQGIPDHAFDGRPVIGICNTWSELTPCNAHFRKIAEAVELPVILYNVPGRTVADMSNDTVLRLSEIGNIVGLKDATGDIGRACDLIKRVPQGFALYSGDDPTGMAFMLCGGHGVISVTSNVAPKLMSAMCQAAIAGNAAEARRINDKLQGLHKFLFAEPNPIPAKWAMHRLGLMPAGLRLPLTPLTAASAPLVEQAMQQAEVL